MLNTLDVHNLQASSQTPNDKAAVTIGNFDGCHRGHQALIAKTCEMARRFAAKSAAVTFTPHPDCFFRGKDAMQLLFTPEQKLRAFAELGLDRAVIQTFDATFAQVRHEAYYQEYLRDQLGMVALTVGANFRFGKDRGGDAAFLAQRGAADGVLVAVDPGVTVAEEPVSSSRLRQLLRDEGDAEAASVMLGRPYLLEGIIERGDQLGRKLGVPTANLGQVDQLIPRYGVYAGYIWLAPSPIDTTARPSVMRRASAAIRAVFNIGVRPSVNSTTAPALRIEGHLLDGQYGENSLYGYRTGFYLTHRLRGEEKFPSLAELRAQMQADIARARTLLS